MIIKIDRSFEKDVDAVNIPKINKQIFFMIEDVKKAKSIEAINGLKNLKDIKTITEFA